MEKDEADDGRHPAAVSPPLASLVTETAFNMPPSRESILEQACPQCPTPTLPSQCMHTAEGRAYLKAQKSAHQLTSSSNEVLPPWYPWVMNHNLSPTRQPVQAVANMESPQSPSRFLDNPGSRNAMPNISATEPTMSEETLPSNRINDTSAQESSGTSRMRVTKKNQLHGNVVGAMRGAKKFEITRMKPLRPPIESQAEASARFLRSASDIIERCERLSNETGCWLYFSTQHVFAQKPFLHYTSPRLLKEGKKDAEQITNHFNKLYASLIACRNEDSKQLHKRLVSAEEEKKAATDALAAARSAEQVAIQQAESSQQQLDFQSEELAAHRLELEALRAQLKLAQRKARV
ncbi:hypothetical protein R3P38DRAFT_2774890 [Favolaschia claudopus]|uniref:Uncharacterized protein n=1 Tax=Favolaschia claudopus TaxID=2862362 RepID=A0AAW0BUT1_9AGAR